MSIKNWVCILALIVGALSNSRGAAGLAFDPAGNLFLLGANPSTIFKFSPDGAVRTFAQATTPGEDWEGIAIDARGNLFVTADATDRSGDVITRILKFTPAGKKSVYVANVGKGQPKTLAIDRDGNLFVSLTSVTKPRGPDAIYKVAVGSKRTSVFTKQVEDPSLMTFDNIGNLYVLQGRGYQQDSPISKFAPNGSEISSMTIKDLYDMACDQSGNLYLALPHINQIEKVAPDGTKTTFAADVDFPWFLAIDTTGNVFVLANGIQKISPDGKKTTFAANPIK